MQDLMTMPGQVGYTPGELRVVLTLMTEACEAEETFGVDALEEWARARRAEREE